MPFPILPSNGSSGYFLTKSLRFRSSASAYLNRTPATTTNRQTWTWSGWVKIGIIGTTQILFVGGQDANNYTNIYFTGSLTGNLELYTTDGGANVGYYYTSSVFRDPSAWYHIVYSVDTTASTKVTIYVNGVAQPLTIFTAMSSSYNTWINTANQHKIGNNQTAGGYLDGYLTEVNFIDGQALTPSSFGSTNALTGVWQPAKYTGTYGTNGFYLPFTNTTSTTTLGYDLSGNSNNWTTNNLSLTAGSTYDSMTDVPTLTSATTANTCTINPLFVPIGGANFDTISNANLTITGTSSSNSGGSAGTISSKTGKFYFEYTMTGVDASGYCGVGASDSDQLATLTPYNYLGYGSKSYGYNSSGSKLNNNGNSAYGSSFTTGDVIGVAIDCDNGAIYFSKNNTWQNSGVPTSGATRTGAAFTWTAGSQNMIPQMDVYRTGSIIACNFGQQPFIYTPPTGFVALNTYNLPTSTIVQGNTVMDAVLWTGDGTSPRTFNYWGFKPDLMWMKGRSNATDNALIDTVRGTGSTVLESNYTDAENNYGITVSAFTSNGFTGTTGSFNFSYANNNGGTYVGWGWQAGQGSSSSNTSGSITSTVSVNASAGFSIVSYTGNDTSGATIGHGLGVAPSMIIVKERSQVRDWSVYHISTGNTGGLLLNTTGAVNNTRSGWWNNTTPSSTVITLGGSSGNDWYQTNQTGQTYIAYCWAQIAGFSAFGSYTGNGSTDGPFVYLGFRPKFVMTKCSSSGSDWLIIDTSRDPYNAEYHILYPDLSNAEETTSIALDGLSNGFKIRNTFGNINSSGQTYIYMAFAENPFKNALAR